MAYNQQPGVTGTIAGGGQYDDLDTVNAAQYDNIAATKANEAAASAAAAETSEGNAAISATEAATSATNSAGSATQSAASATSSANSATASANSAAAALTSEGNASNSETNAADSATASANSATNSANSATASANSATASATSATNSANSATASATSATNSATSATNSATSATASAASASASAAFANQAATSETNAAASATAAATSETNASASALAAATSETNAATSESNAATSEINAATSETNAAGSAALAVTSATNAATSESNAAISATNSATSATASATSASESATSATNSANSALASAVSASAALASEQAAAVEAANAATSASNAATSEANAAVSAATATTQASNAATSASNASASELAAQTAQTAAEAAQVAAETIYDAFDDRYLGSKTTAPTLDNDGNPLADGAIYFDTTYNTLWVYDLGNTIWLEISQLTIASLTDVTLSSITAGELLVWTGTEWINKTLDEAGIVVDGDVGVTVQPYNVNTVIDSAYVHTDNNYTLAEKNLVASATQPGDNVSTLTNDAGYLTGTDLSVSTNAASGAGSLTYNNLTGEFAFTPADSVTTAATANQVELTNTSTSANHYIPFASGNTTGNYGLGVDASLYYNPSLNFLFSSTFIGNISASYGTFNSYVSLTGDNDYVVWGSSSDAKMFYDGVNSTMELELEADATSFIITDNGTTRFTFTKATGDLAATSFTGDLTGNVTGNVTGSSGSTTGNANTSTALETARTIGGVSFDGTANIDLPGVNTAGTQDTSGNAATATNATNVTLTNTDTSASFYIPFASGNATDNYALGVDAGLYYNPGINAITVPSLNISNAINIVSGQVRFGSPSDTRLYYDDANNTMEMELEADAQSFIITDNGTTKFTFTKATGDLIATGNITGANLNVSNWDTAYGWGDHAVAGYLTSYTETDPVYTASSWYTTTNNSSNWNTAYGWGNHASAGYLTSYTETDPVYTASSWYTTTNNSANWNTAYGWGNHASAGYLTGITGQSIKDLSDVNSSMTPSDGQVLTYSTTNGWQAQTPSGGGGGGITYTAYTANATLTADQGAIADTSGGAFTLTLPASPSTGDQVVIVDGTDSFDTNNLTVARNGSTIEGLAEDLVCDIEGVSITFIYNGATWSVYAQIGAASGTAITETATQTLSNKTLVNPTITDYTESVVATGVVSTAHTFALTNGTVQTVTLTASTACTFTMPTAVAGKSFVCLLKQAPTTGNGTATFTGVKWGGTAPTITATAGAMDILSFVSDGTNWYGSITQGYTP